VEVCFELEVAHRDLRVSGGGETHDQQAAISQRRGESMASILGLG